MSHGLVFVCGFPSSGTDLLRNILNAHSRMYIGGEFPLLPSLARDFPAIINPDCVGSAQDAIRRVDIYRNLKNAEADLSSDEPVAFADLYRQMLVAECVDWMGNKTPQNTENIDALLKLFPDARFIIVVRDIRDVAMSWRKKWGKNMYLCAAKWNSRMAKGLGSTANLSPGQYIYIRYENLLECLDVEAKRICEFLDIPFESRMLNFQDYINEKVPGKINFGEPIVKGNSEKWRAALSAAELERIEEIALPMMKEFGYEPELAGTQAPLSRVEIMVCQMRDFLAMLTVGNRSLKQGQAFYRLTSLRVLWRKLIASTSTRIH